MRSTTFIVAVLLMASCDRPDQTTNSSNTSKEPDIHEVCRAYQSLRKMTPQPVIVNPELAMLCRGVTQAEVEKARKAFGPHANTAVTIYMNDLAASAFGMSNPTYPVGSIIVKEKKGLGHWSTTRPQMMVEQGDGVGGMIKRSPGFDPGHRDWEYFYFEDPAKVEAGKMISCIQCHSGAAGRDYVFGAWAHANNQQ